MEYNDNDQIVIKINEMEKYDEINTILNKYCECNAVQEMDFSGKNNDKLAFIICTFYENYNINDLINELDDLIEYINFEDSNSEDKQKYIGNIRINLNKIDYIKFGTHDKLNKIGSLKTEFGYCKRYKPIMSFLEGCEGRLDESSESIGLFSNSLNNLIKLYILIKKELLNFEPNFTLKFELIE